MKKIYSLSMLFFFLSFLVSCKEDEVEPFADDLLGKWNLQMIESDVKTVFGASNEKYDFSGKGGYIKFNEIAHFESNLIMNDEITEFLRIGSVYGSTYLTDTFDNSKNVSALVYDSDYKQNIMVSYKIKSITNGKLVLVVDKHSLGNILKEYDKLDGSTTNSDFFSMVSSAEITLTFTK